MLSLDSSRLSCAIVVGLAVLLVGCAYPENTGVRFATLMRLLCERNGGAFVPSTAPTQRGAPVYLCSPPGFLPDAGGAL